MYNFIQMLGAFMLMLVSFTAASVFGMWLMAYTIKPLAIEETYFDTNGIIWTLDNKSHKTIVGEVFCDNPSNDRYDPANGIKLPPDSRIIFEDSAGHREVIADNATGIGTGTTRTRIWQSTGKVPAGLLPGPIVVWKEVRYQCFADLIHTTVETERFVFTKPIGTSKSGL